MEVIYADILTNHCFKENTITGFYGDVADLIKINMAFEGIVYDDKWTVRRFLNGLSFLKNPRIDSILKYLNIDSKWLNVKICDLPKVTFKYVLLAYLLLKNKKIIIFDHFEIGLSGKEQKNFINLLRTLKKEGLTIILISKDLVFLNQIVDSIEVIVDGSIAYNGAIDKLFTSNNEIVKEPEIIRFIKLANQKGANLNYTLDSKELLKDIYRSVC